MTPEEIERVMRKIERTRRRENARFWLFIVASLLAGVILSWWNAR